MDVTHCHDILYNSDDDLLRQQEPEADYINNTAEWNRQLRHRILGPTPKQPRTLALHEKLDQVQSALERLVEEDSVELGEPVRPSLTFKAPIVVNRTLTSTTSTARSEVDIAPLPLRPPTTKRASHRTQLSISSSSIKGAGTEKGHKSSRMSELLAEQPSRPLNLRRSNPVRENEQVHEAQEPTIDLLPVENAATPSLQLRVSTNGTQITQSNTPGPRHAANLPGSNDTTMEYAAEPNTTPQVKNNYCTLQLRVMPELDVSQIITSTPGRQKQLRTSTSFNHSLPALDDTLLFEDSQTNFFGPTRTAGRSSVVSQKESAKDYLTEIIPEKVRKSRDALARASIVPEFCDPSIEESATPGLIETDGAANESQQTQTMTAHTTSNLISIDHQEEKSRPSATSSVSEIAQLPPVEGAILLESEQDARVPQQHLNEELENQGESEGSVESDQMTDRQGPVQPHIDHTMFVAERTFLDMPANPDDMFERRKRDSYLKKGLDLSCSNAGGSVLQSLTGSTLVLKDPRPIVRLPGKNLAQRIVSAPPMSSRLLEKSTDKGSRAVSLTMPKAFNFSSRVRQRPVEVEERPAKRPRVVPSAVFAAPSSRPHRSEATDHVRTKFAQTSSRGHARSKVATTQHPSAQSKSQGRDSPELTTEALRIQEQSLERIDLDAKMRHFLQQNHQEMSKVDPRPPKLTEKTNQPDVAARTAIATKPFAFRSDSRAERTRPARTENEKDSGINAKKRKLPTQEQASRPAARPFNFATSKRARV